MTSSLLSWPFRAIAFLGWFTVQFIVTSVRVSVLILTPRRQPQPAIVRVTVDDLSDTELTLFVALVTITPDTLVLAIDREQRFVFVHGMFAAGDAEGFRSSLRDTHDRLLRGVRARPPRTETVKEGA